MKYLPSQLLFFLQNKTTRRNFALLSKFFIFLLAIISSYSVIFHAIMLYEGREFSWVTGFYWTLTVMSTLGFGDIIFTTDLGLIFTIFVLLSGVIFFLIMLPFTFIQFFYAPWLEAQTDARTPRKIPEDTHGHVIITNLDPVTKKLIQRLRDRDTPYVVIAEDAQRATELHDAGYKVVFGETDNHKTYENVRIRKAAMVVVTDDDLKNTNIAFTIREITATIPIVTNADKDHSIDILEYPGNMHVFQFMKMLGRSMGNRTIGIHKATKVIGKFDSLHIAEIPAMLTSIRGKKLIDAQIREKSGVIVVGIWEKGKFVAPLPHSRILSTTVLLLAGSESQLEQFDETFSVPHEYSETDIPVLILGGGRVGLAAAEVLDEEGVAHKIVEKRPVIANDKSKFVQGDAADINVLREAGIEDAGSVLITTHNDAMNIYLTFYCRQLRPDIQIVSRATNPRNVNKLHTAGADLVMSYASMATNSIMSILRPEEVGVVMEGLNLFRLPVAKSLVGSTLIESMIRERTGCSVIAIRKKGALLVGPDPRSFLKEDSELILMGSNEAEQKYLELYS